MDSERWKRIEDLFHEAVERPESERAAFLDEACANDPDLRREIEELLARDAAIARDDAVERALGGAASELLDDQGDGLDWAGHRIGPWEIEREIGRGGMGRVLLAHRADGAFERKVAIKLSLGGLASAQMAARLEDERRILAALDHPAIARLLDGGTTDDGVPYVVLEHVEGRPIDAHCADEGLDVPGRLGLFLEVCDAVAHAHRALVVHRDLKPGNILVTPDGRPKLLDFGIAKLLAPDGDAPRDATATFLRALTPDYASPEQLTGAAITTATDVYALGVVLYELLTGVRPFRLDGRTPAEVERAITTETPPRPSTRVRHRRRLRGDLDNIVLKTLRKEPERRYPTVEALAEDLRRHLAGHPVEARPSTWGYRLTRFAGRHRVMLAVGATVSVALIAAGAYHVDRLSKERDRALFAADKAERVALVLEDLFNAAAPQTPEGKDWTALDLLDRGVARAENELADEPLLRAELLRILGTAYRRMAAFDRAETMLDQALALAIEHAGDDSTEAARVRISLGALYSALSREEDAVEVTRRAIEILRAAGPIEPRQVTAIYNLATLRMRAGAYDEAMDLATEVLEQRVALYGEDDVRVTAPLLLVGRIQLRKKEYENARTVLEEVLARRENLLGEDHEDLVPALSGLSTAEEALGNIDLGVEYMERSLAISRKVHPEDHPSVAIARINLCSTHQELGNFERAEELCRAALATFEAKLPPTHQYVATGHERLAWVLAGRGRFDEARTLALRAVEITRAGFDADHPTVARREINASRVLQSAGDLREAVELARVSVERFERTVGPDDAETAIARGILGELLVDRGRLEDGRDTLLASLAVLEPQLGADDLGVIARVHELARAYTRLGELDDARALHDRALERRRRVPNLRDATAASLEDLGAWALRAGRPAEAVGFYEEALGLRRDIHDGPHVEVAIALAGLADAALADDRFGDAAALAEEAADVARDADAPPLHRATVALARARALAASPETADREEAIATLEAALPVIADAYVENDARVREAEALLASLVDPEVR